MKVQEYWLFRNQGDYFDSPIRPKILYSGDTPTDFFLEDRFTRIQEHEICRTNPRALWLGLYEAKKWRVTTEEYGDVHFGLLEWLWIDRK